MCSTEKCVDEHRRQKVYLKPEHLRLKLLRQRSPRASLQKSEGQ